MSLHTLQRPTVVARAFRLPAVVMLLGLGLAACSPPPDALPALPRMQLDPARVSVSGLSSGAYMATQLHLAYSDRVLGAALFAGGPYGCAQGDLDTALGTCMKADASEPPDVARLAELVRERAADGRLAPLAGLAGDRVYVWHGAADQLVAPRVGEATAALYEALAAGVQVSRRLDQPFAHLLPTAGEGGDCSTATEPYLSACGFDAAGAAVKSLHGDTLQAAAAADGQLIEFNAAAYADGASPGADNGYLYVPRQCAAGQRCGLHIAFDGCQQSAQQIGPLFAEQAGFNRWADAAGLVVLYPQARSSMLPLNPKGCWDWWGYSGSDYDTRRGAQLRWVATMAAALGAPLLAE